MFATEPVRVFVPATSANLGPGFDAFALALALEDEVTAQVTDSGLRVDVTGEGATELPRSEDHLVVAAMMRTFDAVGSGRPAGLTLTCHNRIPHARGLGSSSAAIVAGIILARALVVHGGRLIHGKGLDGAAVLRLAAEIEGHPDNVAACLLGGFTVAWDGPSGVRAIRLEPAASVRPAVYIPTMRSLTAQARAALPPTVPHSDAAFTAARAALLVHAMTSDPELLFEGTEDRLHQPYRSPAMPETAALVARLRDAGLPAVVSGAGPTVLALPSAHATTPDAPEGWCVRSLPVSSTGARIVVSRHAEGDPVAAGLLS
jgi:homoserine kinase